MLKYIFWVILFFINSLPSSNASELIVGIEPFPPIFNENGEGLGAELLKAISNSSELNFEIQVMTYARAKKELENKRIDILGIIPKGLETKDFYLYALELDWHFNNHVDIYSSDEQYLNINALSNQSLGTLVGNAAFFSETLDIPLEKFIEVASLEQLVKMMAKKRLKAIVFERYSVITSIQRYIKQPIYYRFLTIVPATLAVTNTEKGQALKQLLDRYIKEVTAVTPFQRQGNYHTLPTQGQVPLI